jgi:hypothetical protein
MRFELMTSSLPRRRSTPELRGRFLGLFAVFSLVRLHTATSQQLVLHLERATRFELATLSLEG